MNKRARRSNSDGIHLGVFHTTIPDLPCMVDGAVESRELPPQLCNWITVGPLWMLLYFITKGMVLIRHHGTIPCPPETALLLPPGTWYRVDTRPTPGNSHHIWMTFDGLHNTSVVPQLKGPYVRYRDPHGALKDAMLAVAETAETHKTTEPFWCLQVLGRVVVDCLAESSTIDPRDGIRIAPRPRTPPDPLIGRVVAFLQDNLHEPVRLSHIAHHVGGSVSMISHHYRRSTGEPPMETLRRMRILRAKSLLLHGSRLAEIADQLGFCDERHLAKTFRKSEGLYPSDFLRQALNSGKTKIQRHNDGRLMTPKQKNDSQ